MIYVIKWEDRETYIHAIFFIGVKRGNLKRKGELVFNTGAEWHLFTQALKSNNDATIIFEEKETQDG